MTRALWLAGLGVALTFGIAEAPFASSSVIDLQWSQSLKSRPATRSELIAAFCEQADVERLFDNHNGVEGCL